MSSAPRSPELLAFAESAPAQQAAQLRRGAARWRCTFRTTFLLLAILVWAAFAEHTAHEHRLALTAVAQRDANLATAVEHYIVRVLRSARAVHRLLGTMLVEGRGEQQVGDMLADRLRANDAFVALGLCLADGRILQRRAGGAGLTPEHCADLLAVPLNYTDVAVLPPVGPAGALQVPLALAIRDDLGQRVAVAVAFTPAQTLLGIMDAARLEDDTTVLVVGDDGIPRAAWRSQGGHVVDPAGFAPMRGLLRAQGDPPRVGDRQQLVAARPVPQAGLRIVVATASADALAAFHGRRLRYLVVCGLASLALLAVYLALSRMYAAGVRRAQALSQARADLQALNAELDSQVRERTAQLEQAYRDLETFSYAVAHDVRAPLASIAGFADALQPLVEASGSDKHRRYLERIRANAVHMDELTGHLLDLGRLARAPVRQDRVDLSALAADVVARLREREPQREVEVTVEPGLQVHGDRALLRQVLENLLGNAWKFSSRRPRAHIALGRLPDPAEGGAATFFVRDDGDGFDSEQAQGLFQPFRRMHGSDEFPGTGVGLAIVHRIVALHGGRLWCQAKPGEGATFFFSLPASPTPAPS